MYSRYIYHALSALAFFLLIAWLTGCSNGENPPAGNFSLSEASGGQMNKTASNAIVITSAKIMISNLRVKGSYIDTTNAENDPDVDEVMLKEGPFVLDLNLANDSNVVTVNTIQAGTYYGAKFEIHKLSENEVSPDSEFVDMATGKTYTVIVQGEYNGSPFTFKSTTSAKELVVFQNPVSVTSTGFINVTLLVDPYSWFTVNGQVLNPADPNNSESINSQIRASFMQGYRDRGGLWHFEGHCWGFVELGL
jgi:hypothetical protein